MWRKIGYNPQNELHRPGGHKMVQLTNISSHLGMYDHPAIIAGPGWEGFDELIWNTIPPFALWAIAVLYVTAKNFRLTMAHAPQ
ncbi:MAG TPA: hypothetical protein VGH74_21905, partial [Planctomycetaceae bacterium]